MGERGGDHRTKRVKRSSPGLAALGLTFLCMYLSVKTNAMYIIFALFGVGILGYHFGVLAQYIMILPSLFLLWEGKF